jgi:iron-sulfur cluster assembly accessory protein
MLRLAVDGGGCAGFTYRFALADEVEDGDTVASTDGVTLVVDPISLDLVRGSAVDYVEDLGGAAFKVTNPNAASGCGCGSSFSV